MTIQTLSTQPFDQIGLWNPQIKSLRDQIRQVGQGLDLKLDDGLGDDASEDSISHLVVVRACTMPTKQKFFGLIPAGTRPATLIVGRIYKSQAELCSPSEDIEQEELEQLATIIQSTNRQVEYQAIA